MKTVIRKSLVSGKVISTEQYDDDEAAERYAESQNKLKGEKMKQIWFVINWQSMINWGELSRHLAGSRMTIRKNKIPKKHEAKIKELEDMIETWLKSLRP
jgi:hypothetical protein